MERGRFLVDAGDALLQILEIMRLQQRQMDVGTRCHVFTLTMKHLKAYGFAGGKLLPKHHLFIHLAWEISIR